MGLSLRTWLALAGVAAIIAAVLGVRAYIGFLEHDRDAWRATAGQAQGQWAAWEGRAGESERRRTREASTASRAAREAAKACDARVTAARRSAAAISTITRKEPTLDQSGRPVRELVPVGRLRDALQPAPR